MMATTRAKQRVSQQATMKDMQKAYRRVQRCVPNVPRAHNVHNSNSNTRTIIHTHVTTIMDIETTGRDIEIAGTGFALTARPVLHTLSLLIPEFNQAPYI
jgi:hypothetical protein